MKMIFAILLSIALASLTTQAQIARKNSSLLVAPAGPNHNVIVENGGLRLEFVRQPDGFACAKILTRQSNTWTQVAAWSPLFRVVSDTRSGVEAWEIRPRKAKLAHASKDSVQFVQAAQDSDGVTWTAGLRVNVDPKRPVARVHYQWKAARLRGVRELLGPNIYAGEGTSGAAKKWGLFPGVEYIDGA